MKWILKFNIHESNPTNPLVSLNMQQLLNKLNKNCQPYSAQYKKDGYNIASNNNIENMCRRQEPQKDVYTTYIIRHIWCYTCMYQIKINTVAPLFVYYIHIKDVCYRQGPVSGGESAIHNSISSSLYLDVSIWRWQEAPAAPDSHIIWILTVTRHNKILQR